MKYFKCFFILFVCFLIVGCGPTIKEKDRDNVIRQLEKLDYIPNDWKLVKEDEYTSWSLEWSETYSYDYVMKDSNDVYHVVSILSHESKPKENIYEINIYDDVIFIDKDKYGDDERTYEFPYSLKNITLKKKGFKWKVDENKKESYTYDTTTFFRTILNTDELDYKIDNPAVATVDKIEEIPSSINDKKSYKIYVKSVGEGSTTIKTFAKGKEEDTTTEYKFIVNNRNDIKIDS